MVSGAGCFELVRRALGDDFVERTIGRELHYSPATPERRSVFAELLTWNDLAELVGSRRLEPPQLRVFSDGSEVDHKVYVRPVVTRANVAYRRLDAAALQRLAASGATVVVNNVDEMHPPVRDLARRAQWWIGEIVQANVYATFNPSQSFPSHWDDHDVIVLQLAGSKRWRVFGPGREHPMHRDAHHEHDGPTDPVWEGMVGAGDVLHIPRGHWHEVVCDGPASLHLVLGATRRTGVDWMTWVADRTRLDPRFRRDLSADTELPHVGEPGLPAEAFSVLRFLEHHRDHTVHRQRLEFAHVAGVAERVRVATPFRPRVVASEGVVEVIAAGHSMTLSGSAGPLVEHLIDGEWHTVADIAARVGTARRAVDRVLERMTELGWLEWS